MTIIQLQLNLWQQLEQAQAEPQATDWRQLCLAFDEAIDRTPVGLRLAIAADAIEQMAEVLAARALAWAEDWYRQPGDGPVLDEDLFSEFVRQSLSLDLSELVAEPELYIRSVSEKFHEDAESVVKYRGKAEVLAELESFVDEDAGDMDAGCEAIAQLEYDENIAAWATAIRQWMELKGVDNVSLSKVVNNTPLSAVKVWLSALLSDFELERMNHKDKDFYNAERLILRTKTFVQCEVA
jgi:hypothetical protein